MNPRAEAAAKIGGRYDARVLEPSPPAVTAPPWFADDPLDPGERSELPLLLPVTGGDALWSEVAAGDPELERWCAERWLGPYRRLGAAPATLADTRGALHALAERVIAPARQRANGKIGLRFTRGGFGTPFFGDDVQVRVTDAELVVQTRAGVRAAPVTTLSAAAAHLGPELLGEWTAQDDPVLAVDPAAAQLLGDWFGFGASVLEELRLGAGPALEPSRVQLWPEHFDIAVELGSDADGQRAGYGASPGDEQHPEPYLYVVPWAEVPDDPVWQATGFRGAELPYSALLDETDQRAAALSFMRARLEALTTKETAP